jgi:hypothetical protein
MKGLIDMKQSDPPPGLSARTAPRPTLARALRVLAVLVALLALSAPRPALAQEPVTLDTLQIRLWPEFDRPSMLIFLAGQVAEGVPVPVELRFTLPPGAEVNAVAYIDPATNSLLNAPYQLDGGVLALTSPNGTFHVEFYDAGLDVRGEERAYALDWAMGYPVEGAVLEVQQPPGARDFVVEPGGGIEVADQYGLTTYRVLIGPLAADEPVGISVRYARSIADLTVDLLEQPGQPRWVFIVLTVVGVGLIGGGVWWWLRPARRRRSSRGPKAARYCTQCGTPVRAGDKFCRNCGAKLRGP